LNQVDFSSKNSSKKMRKYSKVESSSNS